LNIEVKDKEGNVDKSVNKFMYDAIMSAKNPGESLRSLKLAKFILQESDLPIENYRFINPSEFWAVNGSNIVAGDYDAIQGGVLSRLKNWLGKLAEKLKSMFGFQDDQAARLLPDSIETINQPVEPAKTEAPKGGPNGGNR
jgi:hypothetical protein